MTLDPWTYFAFDTVMYEGSLKLTGLMDHKLLAINFMLEIKKNIAHLRETILIKFPHTMFHQQDPSSLLKKRNAIPTQSRVYLNSTLKAALNFKLKPSYQSSALSR